jgi:hypothetical protein
MTVKLKAILTIEKEYVIDTALPPEEAARRQQEQINWEWILQDPDAHPTVQVIPSSSVRSGLAAQA